MTQECKINELKREIRRQLVPLINADYYLLEIPYYTNIGDTLIWQGEIDFLRGIPHKCKGMYSLDTFTFPEISQNEIILFQGGGNFGDLWSKHHEFKLEVVKHYPNNRFLFFPQTVFFQSDDEKRRSAEILGSNKNITICARDSGSYEILESYFNNNILLVPDMAFCIEQHRLKNPFRLRAADKSLFVKRKDKELALDATLSLSNEEIDVYDWPTFVFPPDFPTRILDKLKRNLPKSRFFLDFYAKSFYRRYLLRTGVRFLSRYHTVYTTRLHAAILGIMMAKDVVIIDNTYGKNSGFFRTWLQGTDGVSLM